MKKLLLGLSLAAAFPAAAHAQGALRSDALARFPHLLVAPGVVAIIWDALFSRFEPLDAAALMHAQIDLIFGPEGDA